MKKFMTPLLCTLLSLCVIMGSVFGASSAQATQPVGAVSNAGETRNPDIINGNSYNNYNDVVRTYLTTTDTGYMRVYGVDNGTLLAEYYDKNYRFVSNSYVSSGLPLFGGFYETSNYYFVVTGQENHSQDDSKEVIRITRFTKNWKASGTTSLYGANTTVPFDAGRCSFAEYNNQLFIRTCHEMYMTDDGINHQANMTIVVDIKQQPRVKTYFSDIGHILTAGFLSHSFNQFIVIDSDSRVVCLDHGDAGSSQYPTRGAMLGRYLTKADQLIIWEGNYKTYEYTTVLDYEGYLGDNITGALVGGLACSSSSYITVGTTVEQNGYYRSNHAFNAYYSVTDKTASDLSTANTTVTYLTSFTESDNRYASNPQLVKLNNNRFLVMWNEFPVDYSPYYPLANIFVGGQHTYDSTYKMKYVIIDGKGKKLTKVKTAPSGSGAYVSECDPVVRDNKVLWYVSDGADLSAIIEMDFDGNITSHPVSIPSDLIVYPFNLSKATVAFRSFDKIPSGTKITEKNFEQYLVVCYNGRALTYGKDYVLRSDIDPIIITDKSGENYILSIRLMLSTVDGYSYFPIHYSYSWTAKYGTPYFTGFSAEEDGVHLSVVALRGVGYNIYRKDVAESGDEYTLVGTVNAKEIDSFVDTAAERGKAYSYVVCEYTYDKSGNLIISDPSRAQIVYTLAPEEPDTQAPTQQPTQAPTQQPTQAPTQQPTQAPTQPPTQPPTQSSTQAPSTGTALLGDADKDGMVTILDATVIQRVLASLVGEERLNSKAADADRDGEVTILDATVIQRFLADMQVAHPIGRPIN